MTQKLCTLFVALLLTLLLPQAAAAYPEKAEVSKPAEATEKAEPEKEPEEKKKKGDDKPFDELIEDFEVVEGLFTFYRNEKEGKTYMEIGPEQLDEIFLCSVTRSAGDGAFFDSSAMLGQFPFILHRVGKTIHFLHKNVYFQADKTAAIHRALSRGLSDSLMGTAKIESAPHPERGSILVDPSGLFVQDIAMVGYIFREFIKEHSYSLDPGSSYLGTLKSFPQNSELDAVLYFKSEAPKPVPSLPDSRSFRHVYHYSLSTLPQTGFQPRLADDRVGHFVTLLQDHTSPLRDTPYVRYVDRWHLEKSEPKFETSKPRQPIVFWLENTIPVEYREAVRDGILMWNSAFERIGFKEAIVVEQMPDNADWDPADVRYNTIRWMVQPGGTYAVGPSRTNPFTGQIYDADIRVGSDMLRFVYREFQEFAQPVAQGDAIAARLGILDRTRGLCDHQQGATRQAAFGWNLLAARQSAGTVGGDLEEFIRQFITEVIAHEVGHTLGLRHNFKASTLHPLDGVQQQQAITSSVMDYNPVNVAGRGESQGPYYQTVLGPYDYWAIEYAYRPIDAASPESEKAALERIASRAAEPELQYGTDEDAWSGARGMDPVATRWDLGTDSIGFHRHRLELAEELWSGLEAKFEQPGESYQKLRLVFGQGLGEHFLATVNVTKHIGGIYHRRDHVGDPGGRLPYEPVPAAEQRRALEFLEREIFAPDAFQFPESLLNKLAVDRLPDFSGSIWEQPRNDFPIHETILAMQRMPLDHLYDPILMSRMLDIELRDGDHLTLAEVFSTLRRSIWAELAGGEEIGSVRRNLQRLHLQKLVGLVAKPAPGVPEDATALARFDLKALRGEIDEALAGVGLDGYTRAHLDSSLALIDAALEAGIERQLG